MDANAPAVGVGPRDVDDLDPVVGVANSAHHASPLRS
jgi:hypothetical protein